MHLGQEMMSITSNRKLCHAKNMKMNTRAFNLTRQLLMLSGSTVDPLDSAATKDRNAARGTKMESFILRDLWCFNCAEVCKCMESVEGGVSTRSCLRTWLISPSPEPTFLVAGCVVVNNSPTRVCCGMRLLRNVKRHPGLRLCHMKFDGRNGNA